METLRTDGRACDMLRPIILERAVNRYAEGSALIRWGNTHVLCTASVDDKVPPFLRGSGNGWITAEYAMLPRSTQSRMQREISRGKRDARGSEIQRLIGRSLRAAVDMTRLGERTITIDCDVLQADGGTRTASISAGFVALDKAVFGEVPQQTVSRRHVDVGGGSTEVNFLANGKLLFSRSYNIGTVRTLCGVVKPEEWQRLKSDMAELAKVHAGVGIIGSGGNINKLYRLAPEKNKQNLSFKVSTLRALYDELLPLSVEERMERFSLKSDRADVIVPAAEIFLAIAGLLGVEDIYVPVIGLADGIIDALYEDDCHPVFHSA